MYNNFIDMSIVSIISVQQAVLAVTNTNEGVGFVDQSTGPTVNTTVYTGQLFPNLGLREVQEAASLYSGLGTPLEQVNLMMSESKEDYAINACK
jgi:carboxylesterase 2